VPKVDIQADENGYVKSSYIDSFMDNNLNAIKFADGISKALAGKMHTIGF